MGAAAAGAVCWFSLLTLIQLRLVEHSGARTIAQIDPNSADVNFLVYGTVLGIAVTGLVAWLLLHPVPSTYRRGALAMVSALAGTTLGMALTWFGFQVVGRPALIGLAMVSIGIAIWLARLAARSAR